MSGSTKLTTRKSFVAGNWKMNKTVGQALDFVRGLKDALLKEAASATVVIAPPFTSIGDEFERFRLVLVNTRL